MDVVATPMPALSEREKELIAAFRGTTDAKQKRLVDLTKGFAEQWPARIRPNFQLLQGGAS